MKRRSVKVKKVELKDSNCSPRLFLTPKQWNERWQTKMQQALQMAQ